MEDPAKLEDTLSWSVEYAKKFKDAFSPLIKNLKAGDVKKVKLSECDQGQESFPTPKEIIKETVKILVIFPYCGAKTEQGLAKCQKCGASL